MRRRSVPWPGASAERIEQLVTRQDRGEDRGERAGRAHRVDVAQQRRRSSSSRSTSAPTEPAKEFDDIALRLDSIRDLPPGAGPIEFIKDFGDTAALMLTVASPKVGERRAGAAGRAVSRAPSRRCARGVAPPAPRRPRCRSSRRFQRRSIPRPRRRQRDLVSRTLAGRGAGHGLDVRSSGPGFVGVGLHADGPASATSTAALRRAHDRAAACVRSSIPTSGRRSSSRDPARPSTQLAAVAGDSYSYRELDDFTDLIKRTLADRARRSRRSPAPAAAASRSSSTTRRSGSHGRRSADAPDRDPRRAQHHAAGRHARRRRASRCRSIRRASSRSESEIGDVIVGPSTAGPAGLPARRRRHQPRLPDAAALPELLPVARRRRASGSAAARSRWRSRCARASRSATSATRSTPRWRNCAPRLPADLVVARPSDQPLQVRENVGLFMKSLYEAIALVVLVALIGFWEWRSALLMALAIPLTLAMTFGMMHLLGIDVQQVSIASLIIALGLLVDDPVVAGDAIKRELDRGPAADHRGLARTDQAGHRDPVRDDHQHRRLPAVPDAQRADSATSSTRCRSCWPARWSRRGSSR